MRKDVIKNKINEIYKSLDLINENIPGDFEKFKNLGIVKDGIYKRLEYSIENLIDIFYIINSDLNLDVPLDDADMINNLKEKNIITEKIAIIMKNLKGFRKIVVHRYSKINDYMAYDFIINNLNDFYIVIKCIENIIN